MSLRALLHLVLHAAVPWAAARLWQRPLAALLWMWAGMVVDVDHLLATPVYAPNRCSITHHPLHHPLLWGVYAALALWPKTRWFGVGLCIHMALDTIDCLMM